MVNMPTTLKNLSLIISYTVANLLILLRIIPFDNINSDYSRPNVVIILSDCTRGNLQVSRKHEINLLHKCQNCINKNLQCGFFLAFDNHSRDSHHGK